MSFVEPRSGPDFGFDGRIRRRRLSPSYWLGLLFVALGMLLLPAIYAALIAAVAYGVYYHVFHHVGWLRGGGHVVRLVVYAAPAVAGSVLVLFMIKPLFSRRGEATEERVLRREQEPALFDFIERICRAVGAPFPGRIQANSMINASAGRDLGLVSRGRGGLTLTIGLPLAGGLTLRQFTGVLAHEFGHFSQGAGMRLSLAIRKVNHWFARVVYERDHWDRELDEYCKSGSGYVVALAQCSRLAVWLSRRFLQALMAAGHTISCFLMRQMEFDADGYEAGLVGGTTFAAAVRRLRLLEAGSLSASQDLSRSWSEGWLVDDLPALIVTHTEGLPEEARRAALVRIDTAKTGLFDTHPADLDRIARVSRTEGAGAVPIDGPATALFRDFGALCRAVTKDHYARAVDERVTEEQLRPLAEFLQRSASSREKREAGQRYFQGLLTIVRPFFLGLGEAPAPAIDAERAAERLAAARGRFERAAPAGLDALPFYERAERTRRQTLQAERLLAAKIPIQAQAFGLPTGDAQGVQRASERAAATMQEKAPALELAEAAMRERLLAAFDVLRNPAPSLPVAEHLRKTARFETLVETLGVLERVHADIRELLDAHVRLSALIDSSRSSAVYAKLADDIEAGVRRLLDPLARIRRALEAPRWPFAHGDGAVSIGQVILPNVPSIRDTNGLWQGSSAMIEGFYTLYLRVMGELAAIAEDVERAAGIPA